MNESGYSREDDLRDRVETERGYYGRMCDRAILPGEWDNVKTKQVIVIRKDLKMRRGKEVAQGSHASMAFLTRRFANWANGTAEIEIYDIERKWMFDSFAKVTVQVNSEEELLEIEKKAREAGLECHVVTDSGRTEFGGVPTKTCLAIGPDRSEKIDEITGHLSLY